jgi:pyruvate dehydrogenase E1 component alpha subunit
MAGTGAISGSSPHLSENAETDGVFRRGAEERCSNDVLLALHFDMMRNRRIEEEIARRYADQEMRCPVHLSVGQEAVSAGVCLALEPKDQIVSTHRAHAHYLSKGGALSAMLAEFHGKADGCCGGRGGSMHIFDVPAGVLLSLPIVGSGIPIAAGAALAMKQSSEPQVAVAFLGDAAVEEGVFHETANFAAVHKLPVVFVCENNLYSVYTPLKTRQPDLPLERLGRCHGIVSETGDGNDAEAVHVLTRKAVARARAGEGPSFLVFDTYRWLEHCGPNYDNDIGYRTQAEFELWRERDPLRRSERRLLVSGGLDACKIEEWELAIGAEIDAAFRFALDSPLPAPGPVNVYA